MALKFIRDPLSNTESIKLFEVKGLFHRFNHQIEFNDENDIVIITAPNGYGKTIVLKIINAIFTKQYFLFRKIAFKEIQVKFKSGKIIKITKNKNAITPDKENHLTNDTTIQISAIGFGPEPQVYNLPKFDRRTIKKLARDVSFEEFVSNRWLDYNSIKDIDTEHMIDLYSSEIDRLDPRLSKVPDWLSDISRTVSSHLVETQRLLLITEHNEPSQMSYRRGGSLTSSVVDRESTDLANKINLVLQKYANESQKLDQSLPSRIVSNKGNQNDDASIIRDRLEKLNSKRDELVAAGLIDQSSHDPIQPSDEFSDEVRTFLSIYISDTEKKLGTFDQLYKRISLFKEIINDRFSFKRIEIDRDKGIKAIDMTSGAEIPLSQLSSGEQHELVLIYELLFSVSEGSLILIDEPELSLHVAWQKQFISDIEKIQHVRNLKVVIATHSPQIINDRWDLVQELTASI